MAAKSVARIDSKIFFNDENLRMIVKVRLLGVHSCGDSVKIQAYALFPTGVKKRRKNTKKPFQLVDSALIQSKSTHFCYYRWIHEQIIIKNSSVDWITSCTGRGGGPREFSPENNDRAGAQSDDLTLLIARDHR